LQQALADLAAERERNVRLNAQVEVLLGKDGRNYCLKVEAERDEANALLKKARYFLDPMGPVDPNDRRACINTIDKALA
jgi:hypothetical protein